MMNINNLAIKKECITKDCLSPSNKSKSMHFYSRLSNIFSNCFVMENHVYIQLRFLYYLMCYSIQPINLSPAYKKDVNITLYS